MAPLEPKFIRLINGRNGGRPRTNTKKGETMSDQTHLLERIMGLRVNVNPFGENSWQRQIRHDGELSRLRNENRNLQARVDILQAENNTLRVQLEAALSVISYLEQRLKFHLKSLLEQQTTAETTHRLSKAA
jgi:hypothetical protein